jgi:DNA-binding GntR family transcriptional regulator
VALSGDRKKDLTAKIRQGIETGRFMPNQHLVESELAEWLGVNRVNVRVALGRLEQEGLVISEPNRGSRVRFVTEEEAIQITQLRAAIEGMVAGEAALRATSADKKRLREIIAEMRAAIAATDFIRYSDINEELHAEITAISAHKVGERILKSLSSQIVRFQFRAILLPGRPQQSFAEHREIVDAICDGDSERANAAMQSHLLSVRSALEKKLSERKEGVSTRKPRSTRR